MSWAQEWKILPIVLEKVHCLLPQRRRGCGYAGSGRPGTDLWAEPPCSPPQRFLLASGGNVPIERTAVLMEALLGVAVSTGFVARALDRVAQHLTAAGFDEAVRAALRVENVLCAIVVGNGTDAHGMSVPGPPRGVTLRTPNARLMWYAPIGSRSKSAIAALGVLQSCAGYLVRDDYAGWYGAQLDGV